MNDMPAWLLFLIFAIVVAFAVFAWAIEERCPNCGAWFRRRTLNKSKFDRRGMFKTPARVRYRYQCDECQHRWEVVKDARSGRGGGHGGGP